MFLGKNILDIIVVAVLMLSSIYSFYKGTVREIFSFLALVMGVFFAWQFYHQTARICEGWLGSTGASNTISFIFLFLAGYIITILLGTLLQKVISTIQLKWLDHLGGVIVGLLKGCFLVCLLIFILVMVFPSQSPLIQTSRLAPYLISWSDMVVKFISPAIRQNFHKKIDELKRLRKRQRRASVPLLPFRDHIYCSCEACCLVNLAPDRRKAFAAGACGDGIWWPIWCG
jgi:membrane protein required for colicin V production